MQEESEDCEEGNSQTTTFHDTEFYTAIMDEDLERIDKISKTHGSNFFIKIDVGSINIITKELYILPLHLAASCRRVRSMERLLAARADPNMRDEQGRTTLQLVIASWPKVLRTKPHSMLKISVRTVHQRTEACLRVLCDHGADINAEVGQSQQTALHLSVRYAALSAIQILASYGAAINAVDRTGMTPLHMACGILSKDIIASLISNGADVNVAMKHSGNTPLHLAVFTASMRSGKVSEADFSCISELLEHGAEPDAVNKAGMTPLHEVCSNGNEALVDLLLSYGADINKLTKAGETCLFLFLNHKPNLKHRSLLVKLLSLSSPLTFYNQNGLLPTTLMLPQFSKQRLQLLDLTHQPRSLQDICKIQIYLKRGRGKREELRKFLPERLHDFVFNFWEDKDIIFSETDDLADSSLLPVYPAWLPSVMIN